MGLFASLFGKASQNQQENPVAWKALTSSDQLEGLKKESQNKTVAIFKHSTRCGISRMALRRFEKEFDSEQQENLDIYLLDLLQYKEVSTEIAERFGVHHESPQLIVLKNGEVVNQASHGEISANILYQKDL